MNLSVWRFAHLSLALVASALLLVMAVSGSILSLEPVISGTQSCVTHEAESMPLRDVIHQLQTHQLEVFSIERNEQEQWIAEVLTENGDLERFFVDPATGQKCADLREQKPLFAFMTTLHRSLYMDTPGRFIAGVVAFLLLLLVISGTALLVQRLQGWKHFLRRIRKDTNWQLWHTRLGRLAIVPILLISLTGTWLFVNRFLISEEGSTDPSVVHPNSSDNFLRTTTLAEIDRMDFPFSVEDGDPFIIESDAASYEIDPANGAVQSRIQYPLTTWLKNLSLTLHTGRGNTILSIILGISSLSILFFIYSGFAMAIKRRSGRPRNKFRKEDARIVILYGSENGSTTRFAKTMLDALIRAGQQVYMASLNDYRSFKKMEHLLVITSTYGMGEAPANAGRFAQLVAKTPPKNCQFAVAGFGSLSYPDFCKFAIDTSEQLRSLQLQQVVPTATIHNRSYQGFRQWAMSWGKAVGIALEMPAEMQVHPKATHTFRVTDRSQASEHTGETFLLELDVPKGLRYCSGDLLAIAPPGDPSERHYSIARIDDRILLSIKLHPEGACSQYLHSLTTGASIQARVDRNPDFHYPSKASSAVLISNGTGIAPFLGMLDEQLADIHLFWGGRSKASFTLYKNYAENFAQCGKLKSVHLAYSRDEKQPSYVYDLIRENAPMIADILQSGGYIFICGSLAMQADVTSELQKICQEYLNRPLSYFLERKRIRTDCY